MTTTTTKEEKKMCDYCGDSLAVRTIRPPNNDDDYCWDSNGDRIPPSYDEVCRLCYAENRIEELEREIEHLRREIKN